MNVKLVSITQSLIAEKQLTPEAIRDVFAGQSPTISKSLELCSEAVDHPAHYGGAENTYEAIKIIEAWDLGFNLGNTVKYISRAGKKDLTKTLEDLKKARWYLDREIQKLEQ